MYQSTLFIFHIAMVFMLIGFGIFFWMIYKPFKKVCKRGRKASRRMKKFKKLDK
jgi:F0F1-type ATP synthase membrane subunit b/b'